MKSYRLLSCVLFLALTGNLSAGAQGLSKWSVTLTPTILSYSVGVQPGVEVALGSRWAILTEAGIPVKSLAERFDERTAFRLSSQLKWTIRPGVRDAYLSFQAGRVFRTFTENGPGNFTERLYADTGYRYSSARIHSPITTLTLFYGANRPVGERFFIDMAAGMGARVIATSYDATGVQPISIQKPRDKIFPAPDPAESCNCTVTRFRFSVAVRVGYRLR